VSLEKLRKEDLIDIAEKAGGVDYSEEDNKPVLIAKIVEAGITLDSAADLNAAAAEMVAKNTKVKEEEYQKQEKKLMKTNRENPTFEIRGVIFRKDQPFSLVPEEDAEWIAQNIEGIRFATPGELKDYYS
jgi:hypothetical protein